MPRIDDDRDLAHERDMAQLRREQLAAEDFSDSELLGDPDEYWEHYPLSDEGAEEIDF